MNIDNGITYQIYTINQLTNWLLHNADNGISDYMITRARAWVLINNPSASDDDIVLVAAFDEDKSIGYIKKQLLICLI